MAGSKLGTAVEAGLQLFGVGLGGAGESGDDRGCDYHSDESKADKKIMHGRNPSGGVRSCSSRTHPHHDHDAGNGFPKSHKYRVSNQDSGSDYPTSEGVHAIFAFIAGLSGCEESFQPFLTQDRRRSHRSDRATACLRRTPQPDAPARRYGGLLHV